MANEKLKGLIKEILEEEGLDSLKIGDRTAYITNDQLHISASTPKAHLEGTETNAKNLSVRENAGVIEIYDEANGSVVMTIESHQARHQPGGADEISALQTVKRNASGAVVFTGVGTISTAATATGTYTTKTTNVGPVSFSQAILKLAGAFTTAKAIIKRNGSTLTSLTATGTVTVTNSNLGLTGTNTWTLSATMSAGTSITATATVNKDSRQTVNVR